MRYIGSKKRLLNFIEEVINKYKIEKNVFADVFGGTGAVGIWAKNYGYKVISNDLLYFSYLIQSLNIKYNSYPLFNGLNFLSSKEPKDRVTELINFLNDKEKKKVGFITKNYSPYKNGDRKYFSEENAKRIDFIREEIEDWYVNKKIILEEYNFLLAILVESVPFISNISGVYGAYLKNWDKRALKDIELKVPEIKSNNKNNEIYNVDANELIKSIESDVLYLDPPYNARQYVSNYHLLETIALGDNPEIKGKTGLRSNDFDKKSKYCSKREVLKAFENLVMNCKTKLIVLSYNSEGLMTEEEIVSILSKRGLVEVHKLEYRRFQSDSVKENRKILTNTVDEIIFTCLIK